MGIQAVDRPGKHLGGCSFACAAGSAEKICVGDMAGLNLIPERSGNMGLAYNVFKYQRPPFSVNCLVCHIFHLLC